MTVELIKYQPEEEYQEDDALRVLRPLLDGQAIALIVSDSRIIKKRRLKGEKPILFIAPIECFQPNLDEPYLVIGLQGHGCEVVKIDDVKSTILHRVGLSMKSSRVLKEAIDELYGVRKDG